MIRHPREALLLTLVATLTTGGVVAWHAPSLPLWPLLACEAWALLWLGRLGLNQLMWRRLHHNETTFMRAHEIDRQDALLVGHGYRWTSKHTAMLRELTRAEGVLPAATDPRGGAPALHAIGAGDSQAVTVAWSDLPGHMGIQGATRVGKSELLRLMLAQVIRRSDGPVVLIDPKGGASLCTQAIAEAAHLGRRVAVMCPALPHLSAAFNPLSTCQSAVEVAARVRTLFPPTKEAFFTSNPVHTVQMVAQMQGATGQPWSLRHLYRDTMVQRHRLQLLVAYLGTLGMDVSGWSGGRLPQVGKIKQAVQQAGLEDPMVDEILSLCELAPETFTQTHSNLSLALSGLIDTDDAGRFDPAPDALTWDMVERDKMVLVVLTNSLLTREAGNKVGRLILQDLVGYAGERYLRHRAPDPVPITVLVDEFGEVLYPDLIQAVNKLGEAGVRFVMAWQSESDIADALGPEGAQSMLANVGSRVTLRLADHDSAEAASRAYGECQVMEMSDGTSMTTHGRDAKTTHAMRRQSPLKAPLVSPDWFKALPKGEGYALLQGAVYKVSVPLLEAPDETVVREAGYGDLLPRGRHGGAGAAGCPVPSGTAPAGDETSGQPDGVRVPSDGLDGWHP